ncbi:MAG TPA: helix-turn-helix transcriptional regulator [Amycolatopsis sp.]|uniref:helix-turn-helix domain-containing protein n=1 Tax=Amycolatopsis sp. TaxID=37632 RepID=UPI002B4630D9|nr:helix-turn-helix transcriptional regulator [Amycolatopsis sp.]HKS45543.1 helix-turn-helix transcriptional regulator [Amycolatopsis sp.]
MTEDMPFGERLKRARTRAGMSRPVLGSLMGKSAEWVKAIETGRNLPPRLPTVLRLAEVLSVHDLAELTGDERLKTSTFGRTTHEQLSEVANAVVSYPMPSQIGPADLGDLQVRVRQTWELWHGARHHRTAIAALLPTLLRDARIVTRWTEGADHSLALTLQAQTYHLAQLYLSWQPTPELITLTGDRAMIAAQDADDPYAIAAAAWYVNHVYRDAGQQHDARMELANDAAALLDPERSDEDRALYGLLHLAVALSHAKLGHDGDAWHYWDTADRAVKALPGSYTHPWLLFGRGMVDAYAITMLLDLARPGEAMRHADRVDVDSIGSATRRSFHTIEVARAYHADRQDLATVHLLKRAELTAPDTARFNLFTRGVVPELAEHGGTTVRDDARALADQLGLTA